MKEGYWLLGRREKYEDNELFDEVRVLEAKEENCEGNEYVFL